MIDSRLFACVLCFFALTGCAAIDDEPTRTAPTYTEGPKPYYYLDGADIDSYYALSPTDKKTYRDKYIEKGLIYSTENYNAFKDRLYSDDTIGGLGLDVATLGISGVGSFIEGTQTLQALHAIVGGLTGVKSAVDKRALLQQTVNTIVDKMDAQRARVELRLLKGLETGIDTYSLILAYRDMRAFYEAGTIKGALSGLATTASLERDAATQLVDTETFVFKLDAAAKSLQDALCTNSDCTDFDTTVLTAVRACQQNLGLANALLLDLVFKDEHATNRANIEKCLRDGGVI